MTRKSSSNPRIPHLPAIDLAVFKLSPVTIRTTIPARWHLTIASGTYDRETANRTKVVIYHKIPFIGPSVW